MQTGQFKLKMSSPENISPPEDEEIPVLSKLGGLSTNMQGFREFSHSAWHTARVWP